MTALTHAISCPLCSLRRRVRITHLRRKQVTVLFLHQALSFHLSSSLFIFFTTWWTCDGLWTTIDLWRWILNLLCLCRRVCEILCACDVIYMWIWVCDEMDAIYMCYIVFVISEMWYISIICCVCDYRIKNNNNFRAFAGCPGPSTRQNWEFACSGFPALPSVRLEHPTKIFLIKKIGKTFAVVLAAGKEIQKKKSKFFVGCLWYGTWLPAKTFVGARQKAPDKDSFAGSVFAGGSLPGAAPGKGIAGCFGDFAGCFLHPTKRLNPVVIFLLRQIS